MSNKEMVSVRLHTDTKRRVERYAEEHDVSRSTAIRRLLEKGADLEEAGLTVATSRQPREDDREEEEVIADGGQVVRPMLNLLGAMYAFFSLSIFALMGLVTFGNVVLPFIDYTSIFTMMLSSLLLLAVITIFLYSSYPEKADRLFHSGAQKVSRFTSSLRGGFKA